MIYEEFPSGGLLFMKKSVGGELMPGPGFHGGLGPRGFLTDEEKNNLPQVDSKLLIRILSYMKPYWLQFVFVFVAILISAVVGLLPSIITGKIVD